MQALIQIPRPRAAVWEEWEAGNHPAWSDPPDLAPRRIEGTPSFGVGAASVAILPPPAGSSVRRVMYFETVALTPGFSVTTQALIAGLSYVETVALRDTVDGGTLARIQGTLTGPIDSAPGALMAARIERIAERYLARAAQWRDGDPHISSAIAYDPNDPLTG